jgi:AAA15 family ATPase/GTPase
MKLYKIEINNFRGIKDRQIISFADMNTFVGRNDSGKSIVLNAVASFLDNKGYPIESKDFNINRNSDDSIEIISTFSGDDLRGKLIEYVKNSRKKDVGVEEEVESILSGSNMLVVKKIWNIPDKKPSKCQISIKDFKSEEFRGLSEKTDKVLDGILKKLSIEIPPEHPGRNSKLEKVKYIKSYLIKNNTEQEVVWKDEPKIDDLLPDIEFFPADHAISTDTKFNTSLKTETIDFFKQEKDKDNSKLQSIENEATIKMQDEAIEIEKYMKMHVTDLDKIEIEPHFNWVDAIKDVTVKLKFTKDKEAIPMENKGAGYRRLFMVGRFRYLAAKKKSEDVIYAIEEPETFLHPLAQSDLLDSLIDISNSNQILLTTHSPVFAGATYAASVVLCKQDAQSTYKQGIDDMLIAEIIQELGIKPSYNLRDHFENIIFVEGKDDIEFLKIAALKLKKVDLNDSKNAKRLLFLFGGGNTLANFVDIEYFSRAKRNLFLMLDGNIYDPKECTDEQKKSFDDTINRNLAFKQKFEQKENSACAILNKKYIESYYHPRAIERKYGLKQNTIKFDLFPSNKDMIKYLKEKKDEWGVNIKIKGNTDIFNEMTEEEWIAVSNKEVEDIIDKFCS